MDAAAGQSSRSIHLEWLCAGLRSPRNTQADLGAAYQIFIAVAIAVNIRFN